MKNLIIRALTGIIFVVVLISAIYIHPIFFLILFCIITGLTLWEFGGLVKHYENANLQRTVNVLGGVYLFIATFVYANGLTDGKIFLPYLLFIMLTMIAELYYKAPNPINNWFLARKKEDALCPGLLCRLLLHIEFHRRRTGDTWCHELHAALYHGDLYFCLAGRYRSILGRLLDRKT